MRVVPALAFLGAVAPWNAAAAAAEDKLTVAASILPLADFCRQIGGERVAVQLLIPPGASPHVFEPPPSVIAQAARARVLVYIGAGLEPWVDKVRRARGSGSVTVVEAAQGIPLLGAHEDVGHQHQGRGPADHGAAPGAVPHAGEHHHRGGNPHIWLDPALAQNICRRLAAALIQADPEHQSLYEKNLDHYLARLAQLDDDIRRRVETWRVRDFVSFHAAFAYFARRYHLREAGVIEAAPGREPTPRQLAALVRDIRKLGIRVVFAEPQFSPRVAEVIAREAGAGVLFLDPMGGRPPYGDDYLKLMRHNLNVMAEAMQ